MKETQRKCQGCGLVQNRNLMIKITRTKEGLIINPKSKEVGRSIYVCKNKACVKNLIKKKRVKTGLKFNDFEAIKKIEDELLNLC